jgi:hypothetical protein
MAEPISWDKPETWSKFATDCHQIDFLKRYYCHNVEQATERVLTEDVVQLIASYAADVTNVLVDVRDQWQKWCVGQVVQVDEENAKLKIHPVGWSDRWDIWLPMDSPDVARYQTHTMKTITWIGNIQK